MIRKARQEDIRAVVRIYDAIHTQEEAGRLTTGWKRGIYPTEETAVDALAKGSLYVLERDGTVLAAAKIDHIQLPAYREADWMYEAPDEDVLVLHTLTVDPAAMSRGCGPEFMAYYEEYARENGFGHLRIDTNARNTYARAFYHRLGLPGSRHRPVRLQRAEGRASRLPGKAGAGAGATRHHLGIGIIFGFSLKSSSGLPQPEGRGLYT